MSKIVLGKRPDFIESTVTFPMPDGTDGVISVKYKYRTRTEYAEFIDKMIQSGGASSEEKTLAEMARRGIKSDAANLGEILESWDLDVKLSQESLEQFSDELPAGVAAIMSDYGLRIREGRLGN